MSEAKCYWCGASPADNQFWVNNQGDTIEQCQGGYFAAVCAECFKKHSPFIAPVGIQFGFITEADLVENLSVEAEFISGFVSNEEHAIEVRLLWKDKVISKSRV
jgi:hypothetical protein